MNVRKVFTVSAALLLLVTGGCGGVETSTNQVEITNVVDESKGGLVLPVQEYAERLTVKAFGEWISDRFSGLHVGDDIEFTDVREKVEARAIAEGIVRRSEFVNGYGGLVIIEHEIEGEVITALYGHLDSNTTPQIGKTVKTAEVIGVLGEDKSIETDWERKHLHFALYKGADNRVNGYESQAIAAENWLNPYNFFAQNSVALERGARTFTQGELGSNLFQIEFTVPPEWEVEYIPSIQSLNLFTLEGEGTARERSQILIRYFDAADFLTLSTVEIHSTKDLEVGNGYEARRYDIEKKPGVPNFADQPAWRNERHIVTDFRKSTGFGRYYVVAKNPALDAEAYEAFLQSIK